MTRVVVIDTETTGLSPLKGGHRVVEIAAIEIIDGQITGQLFHSYVNPEGKKSSVRAQKVHQLNASFLSAQPLFSEIPEALLEFIHRAELSYYNLEFDQSFIQSEFDKASFDIVFSRDYQSSCLMMDFANQKNKGKRLSLDNACRRFGIDISERKVHGAVVDAQLTAELYIKLHYSEEKALIKTPQTKKHTPLKPYQSLALISILLQAR